MLRKKADARLPNNEQNQLTIREPTERFNLFEDLEKQKGEEKNEENEAEQKEKDKKWDRQITMYLDKGSTKGMLAHLQATVFYSKLQYRGRALVYKRK